MRTRRKKKNNSRKTKHFKNRLKERYNLDIDNEYNINKKKILYRQKLTAARSKILTIFDEIIVLLIYNKNQRATLTALPINRYTMKGFFYLYRVKEEVNE